jgi:hypothetical protein
MQRARFWLSESNSQPFYTFDGARRRRNAFYAIKQGTTPLFLALRLILFCCCSCAAILGTYVAMQRVVAGIAWLAITLRDGWTNSWVGCFSKRLASLRAKQRATGKRTQTSQCNSHDETEHAAQDTSKSSTALYPPRNTQSWAPPI